MSTCAFPSTAMGPPEVLKAVVLLDVLVLEDGRVGEAVVLSESSPGFGEAARKCAMESGTFEPARDANGTPVAKSTKLRMKFSR